ncbi:uncharacterized protein AKAW2_51143A [Aspergillus luchuensis]|uniref:Similar to An04g01110 n=1 Tax=Aspergillus kawachii TaxID=1069201 RepID=A0A146FI28_ASPKA|nr:uncharacterized protein AKAW2_51143A [Aspergillus luchuensis]BCS00802.1 hypothetical protein AKAW2_51143A [Aspergillus luchuensis]BCS12563.1 hypothetical protein ALUC_50609A [Aspergillus luchuensis]GAA82594.1 similar to An04g01110 [Aspergillus luchuensis IFO 4308]GAT25526.1 similar to An04g01110 [Aspergillus luchuensis]
MGIPLFCESSADAPKNNPVKDPCATARSAIRRQASIRRPSRYGGSALRSATLRSPFPRPLVDEIEREANGLQRHVRSPLSNSSSADDPFDLARGLLDSDRREAGQRLLSDALRHGRPGQRLRIPRSSALPDLYNRPSPGDDTTNRPDQTHPQFTPRFAPAIAYHRTASPQARPEAARLSPFLRPDGLGSDISISAGFPTLRRVGERSINEANRPNRESAIDGLGDRQRSLSPDDDHANDAWETLLTTITPDTNLPSADSSFTSASASGTNASTVGTSTSSATSLQMSNPMESGTGTGTVQMVLDPYPEFLNPCDYSSSSDSDSDSETGISSNALFRRYRRVRQMESLRRAQHLQSTMSNHPPIPTISFAFSDSSSTSTDPDLQQMQAILDRLARREDIPEEWWAAAGLSRTLGRRLGANDDTNDTDSVDGPLRSR